MKVNIQKKPKSTLEISITVPADKVASVYSEVIKNVVTKTELPGFRKGQAPQNLVEEKTNVSELYGEVVNKLLEKYYPQALKENKVSPISNPKVEIKEFDPKKDFEFVATVATKPKIDVPEYKKALKNLSEQKKKDAKDDTPSQLTAQEVIAKLTEIAKVDIADILVDEETDRMMVRLMNQIQSLGMNIDEYLKAQNVTAEKLRENYKKIGEQSIKAEFVLQHLVEKEKVKISDKEIEDAINTLGNEKAKEQMQSDMQKWYITSVQAKNKLLEGLISDLGDKKEDKTNEK